MANQHSRFQTYLTYIATAIASLNPPEARKEDDGADVSMWQDVIDWDKYFNHFYQPKFALTRCTLGTTAVDKYWRANADAIKSRGKRRGDYFVIISNLPVRDQVKHYLDTASANYPDHLVVADIERVDGRTPSQLIGVIYDTWDELTRVTDKAWIYSAKWFLDTYVTKRTDAPLFFSEVNWHLAQYLTSRYEHPGPVALPFGVPSGKVVCHQTTDKLYGTEFGMKSQEMDYNRILINNADYWFVTDPPPPPVTTAEFKMVVVNGCTLRKIPDTTGDALLPTTIPVGTVLDVKDIAGSSAWVKVNYAGQEGYAAVEYSGKRYMNRV